jgi:hypothetical protein
MTAKEKLDKVEEIRQQWLHGLLHPEEAVDFMIAHLIDGTVPSKVEGP